METLVQTGLTNALIATFLALIVLLVSRFCRRPALLHSLWLLVLLKLIMPPLVHLPLIPWPEGNSSKGEDPRPGERQLVHWFFASKDSPGSDGNQTVEKNAARIQLLDEIEAIQMAAEKAEQDAFNQQLLTWGILCFGLVWLAGTICWFSCAGWRLYRFTRLLRYAVPANENLVNRASKLSGALGLRSIPAILLIPGQLAPMLWNLGKSALILPQQLFYLLTPIKQETLILHELAHWKRGDHRVRWLELLVRGLYWWHPLVWLACREIQEAEEQLCDAWVVNTLPGLEKTYALTLVETLDFLGNVHPPLPVAASGIGPVNDLKRRLQMIMNRNTSRSLTWLGRAGLLGLGTVLLALGPTWAQTEKIQKEVEARLENFRVAGQSFTFTVDDPNTKNAPDDRANQLKADLERKRAELAKLEAELARLKAVQEKAKSTTPEKSEKKLEYRIRVEGKDGVLEADSLQLLIEGGGTLRLVKPEPKKKEIEMKIRVDRPGIDLKKPEENNKPAPQKPKEIILREINGQWTVIGPSGATNAAFTNGKEEVWIFTTPEIKSGGPINLDIGMPQILWNVVPGQTIPTLKVGVKTNPVEPAKGTSEKKPEISGNIGFYIQSDDPKAKPVGASEKKPEIGGNIGFYIQSDDPKAKPAGASEKKPEVGNGIRFLIQSDDPKAKPAGASEKKPEVNINRVDRLIKDAFIVEGQSKIIKDKPKEITISSSGSGQTGGIPARVKIIGSGTTLYRESKTEPVSADQRIQLLEKRLAEMEAELKKLKKTGN